MKKLLLLLLIPLFTQAQLGLDILTNNGFETFTGTADDGTTDSWTGWATAAAVAPAYVDAESVEIHSGTYSMHIHPSATAAARMQKLDFACADATLYDIRYWYKSVTVGLRLLVRDGSGSPDLLDAIMADGAAFQQYIGYFTSQSATLDLLYGLTQVVSDNWLDDFYIRPRLGTQYIDVTNGNDANAGSTSAAGAIATLAEGLQTRGTYNGGIFSIAAGTYDESVTVSGQSGFTINADGDVTITQVDFNGYTCTVDCQFYNGIGTVLNASNVTVVNTDCDDGQDKGYKEFPRDTRKTRLHRKVRSGR